ncbi:MAG TPA: MFS transporter [Candidatus Cybelea sp.]|nr:MFS transporter [Candidatus Cybelea sp.]
MATIPSDSGKLARPLRRVLLLLTLSIFINYIDRGNLSIAAPLLKDELGLAPWELGILLSSFFWTYTAFQIPSGWLTDRVDVSWVLAGGFLIWSCATAATGLMHGFIALLAVRLVLGMGEAVAYPSYAKILARDFSIRHRGVGNGAIAAGQFCGPAIGTLAGGMLMVRFGWRPFFIVLGLVSMGWLIPWFRWRPRPGAASVARRGPPEPGSHITAILKQRSFWGASVSHFCCNYLVYFLLTWLPYYLVRERNCSMDRMAKIGGLAFLLSAVCSVISGWISDRWIAPRPSASRGRKKLFVVGLAGAGVSLMLCVIATPSISVALLLAGSSLYGICNPHLFAGAQTLAGPLAAGQWMGVQNFVGNFAGIAAPALTGFLVSVTGHFFWPFAVLGVLTLVGSLSWLFIVGPVEPVTWPVASAAETVPG